MCDNLARLSLFGLFSTQAVESNFGMEDLCHTISTEAGRYTPCYPTNYNLTKHETQLLVMLRSLKYNTCKKNVFDIRIYI